MKRWAIVCITLGLGVGLVALGWLHVLAYHAPDKGVFPFVLCCDLAVAALLVGVAIVEGKVDA